MAEFGVNRRKHSAADDAMLHAAGIVYQVEEPYLILPEGYSVKVKYGPADILSIVTPDGREFEIWTKDEDGQTQTNEQRARAYNAEMLKLERQAAREDDDDDEEDEE